MGISDNTWTIQDDINEEFLVRIWVPTMDDIRWWTKDKSIQNSSFSTTIDRCIMNIHWYQRNNLEEMDQETRSIDIRIYQVKLPCDIPFMPTCQLVSFLYHRQSILYINHNSEYHLQQQLLHPTGDWSFAYVQDIHNGKHRLNLDVYQQSIDESLWKRMVLMYISRSTRLDLQAITEHGLSSSWYGKDKVNQRMNHDVLSKMLIIVSNSMTRRNLFTSTQCM